MRISARTPGSAPPDRQHVDEEGVLIDKVQLVSAGRLREADARAVLASGRYPCRNSDQNIADLKAQVAAKATGMAELERNYATYGAPVVSACMAHVQAKAEESVRGVIDHLADGAFTYHMDKGQTIDVSVSVYKSARTATVDFTEPSAQHRGNYNAPYAVRWAVVLYVFCTLVGVKHSAE